MAPIPLRRNPVLTVRTPKTTLSIRTTNQLQRVSEEHIIVAFLRSSFQQLTCFFGPANSLCSLSVYYCHSRHQQSNHHQCHHRKPQADRKSLYIPRGRFRGEYLPDSDACSVSKAECHPDHRSPFEVASCVVLKPYERQTGCGINAEGDN